VTKEKAMMNVRTKKREDFKEAIFYGYRKSIAVIMFFVLWEIAPRIGLLDRQFIPPLSEVLEKLWEMLIAGKLNEHIVASFARSVLGFLFAAVIALPLGFLLGGWFKKFEEYLNPLLSVMSQVNPFSVFPLFILLFGIGETAKIAIIFWVCIWPILFGTITGVKNIDPLLVKAASAMGTPKVMLFSKVVLPGAAPTIFSGLKQGAGIAFFMLIAAEMIGATAGLGFIVLRSQINYQIKELFVAVVVIAVMGLAITYLISFVERKLITWKEETTVR
jgi:NitT/TauT family transport system permease protein